MRIGNYFYAPGSTETNFINRVNESGDVKRPFATVLPAINCVLKERAYNFILSVIEFHTE